METIVLYPRNGVLALVAQLGEVLEIVNLHDTTRHFIVAGPNCEPASHPHGDEAIPNGIMGFSDIHIADHYIYIAFHGRKFADIGRNGDTTDGGKYTTSSTSKETPSTATSWIISSTPSTSTSSAKRSSPSMSTTTTHYRILPP